MRTRLGFFSRPTREPQEPEAIDVQENQPSGGASIISTDLDQREEGLDAVAGSEFVDDRIRERE